MAKFGKKLQAKSENVYVLTVYLANDQMQRKFLKKFSKKLVSRTIEIRGDQTLEELHEIIFKAFERYDEHLYEFEFGSQPRERGAPKFGIPDPQWNDDGDASSTSLDDLALEPEWVFGYLFDFGDCWYHQILVDRIIPVVNVLKYPRIIERRHESPAQYPMDDEDDE
jgi:hypothetical protein